MPSPTSEFVTRITAARRLGDSQSLVVFHHRDLPALFARHHLRSDLQNRQLESLVRLCSSPSTAAHRPAADVTTSSRLISLYFSRHRKPPSTTVAHPCDRRLFPSQRISYRSASTLLPTLPPSHCNRHCHRPPFPLTDNISLSLPLALFPVFAVESAVAAVAAARRLAPPLSLSSLAQTQ